MAQEQPLFDGSGSAASQPYNDRNDDAMDVFNSILNTDATNSLVADSTTLNLVGHASAPQFSASTEELLRRINSHAANPASASYLAAREQVLKGMIRSSSVALPETAGPTKRGRGRGRGSTPRGAATAGARSESLSTPSAATPDPTRGRGRGRGGKIRGRGRGGGRGGKRKRNDSDEDGRASSPSEDDFEDDIDIEADPEQTSTTPAMKLPLPEPAMEDTSPKITKSGRAIHKPTQFIPPPDPLPTSGTKKRRSVQKKAANPEAALCKMCDRGHSPDQNQVVFCDGCSGAWHQFCHDPPIDRMTVLIPDKEWFCGGCTRKREKKSGTVGTILSASLGSEEVKEVGVERGLAWISGEKMSVGERRAHLSILSHEELIDALLRAVQLYPMLPVFKTPGLTAKPIKQPTLLRLITNGTLKAPTQITQPPPQTTSPKQHQQQVPKDATPPFANDDSPGDELDYIEDEDDLPPHYPKPGNGLAKAMLRQEDESQSWFVDDNFRVFSHQVGFGEGDTGAGASAGMAMAIEGTMF